MKKTISVNLANRNFYIEEDAYNMLDEYIKSIREHYRKLDPDGEVAQDFEIRLSELFDEKLRLGYTVISVSMASDVIRQLGELDDLKEEAVPGAEGVDPSVEPTAEKARDKQSDAGGATRPGSTGADEPKKSHRKLFREPRGKVLGGVLSGLAKYVDTDPMLIRLIFIILFFTPAHVMVVVLYIAGWLFIPEAATAADRLAMEGKEVNSENLWTKISEDSSDDSIRRVMKDGEEVPIDGEKAVKKKKTKNWVWWIVAVIALAGAIATLIWLIVAVNDGWLMRYSFLPQEFDIGITVFAGIILAIFAIGLGLLIAGLIIYVLGVLPIGIIIKSKKLTPQVKVLLILGWLLILTFWIW